MSQAPVPSVPAIPAVPTTPAAPATHTVGPINFNNVQGDVLLGLPKKRETFLFFQIRDTVAFRKVLATSIIPLITTTAQVQKDREAIADHKARKCPGLHPVAGINIALSKAGLLKLDIHDLFKDAAFDAGQLKDAQTLGDAGKQDGASFDPFWRSEFKTTIHGVLLFTGESADSVNQRIHKVERAFKMDDGEHSVIVEVLRVKGQVRPGFESGHEHFGFADGISQPSVIGVDKPPLPGNPQAIRPGVILFGREGDAESRPEWATDSSFLVFRQLNQLVPEFDKFLTEHALSTPGLDFKHSRDLLGARLVGRWKSGAPVDVTDKFDDPILAKNPHLNNKFDFGTNASQELCPFAAHIRKTMPRSDLTSLPNFDFASFLERRRIIRSGIPFGPEVSASETINQATEHERGLAFVSYQSSIVNGFQFIQHSWANEPKFIFGKGVEPGFDPIIGANGGAVRDVVGLNVLSPDTKTSLPNDFVVPKGGEYFISPSLDALRTKFGLL